MESLAEKLGVSSTALNDWMTQAGLTIEDMQSDVFQKTAVADLSGGLAMVNGGAIAKADEAPIASTKTKAPKKGSKLTKGQEKALTKAQEKAQQAQQVQQRLDSTLTTQVQSIAAKVSGTLDTIDALTYGAGDAIAERLATADMVIAEVAMKRLEEVSPKTGVSFSQLDSLVETTTASFG